MCLVNRKAARTKNTMAESFPAFLRTLERSIQPLEGLAGVAPPFRDEDEVEETTASDLAFVLRDLRRAAAGARALITSTNLPESSDDEGTQIIERTQLDDAAPTVPYASQPSNEETQTQREPAPILDGVVVGGVPLTASAVHLGCSALGEGGVDLVVVTVVSVD